MKKINIRSVINYTLGIYLAAWIYYAIFNWKIFSIQLNTNAGFSIISGYPIAFFFLFGFAALLMLKYFVGINSLHQEKLARERTHRISILEKDIELLKLKEVLFSMQTSELDKNSTYLKALHEKLDKLSNRLNENKTGELKENDTSGKG